MANITTNLGPVSAYLDAVAHGYTGTREEFGEYLAHVGDNAAAAAASAQRAAASESAAAGSESAAAGSATAAAGSASAAGQQADNAAVSAATASTAATAAKDAETGAQTAQAAAESAQSAAEAAQAAAEAVLESIPEDYSTLSDEVDDLKIAVAHYYDDNIVDFDYQILFTCGLNANNTWSIGARKSYFVPIPYNATKASVVSNVTRGSIVAFLVDDSHVSGETAHYATGASRVFIAAGDVWESEIPADANYLFVNRNSNTGDIYLPVTVSFEIKDAVLPLGLHERPETQGHLNIVKRARQLTDIEWTPAVDLPRFCAVQRDSTIPDTAEVQYFNGKFKAGVTYKGIPYGRAGAMKNAYGIDNAFVGLNIPFETFVTSAENPNSKFSLESAYSESTHRATLFAVVCSALGSYALNVSFRDTSVFPNINGLKEIGTVNDNGTLLSNIKIGDILCIAGYHVAVVTDIIRNADGTINIIEISDASTVGCADKNYSDGQAGGICRRKGWTAAQFYESWRDYIVYRYLYAHKVPYAPNPYVNVGDEPDGWRIDHYPCMPYEGNKFSFNVGKIPNSAVKIIISPNLGYSYLRVFKDGTEISGSPFTVESDTESIDISEISAGEYSAYLCNITDGNVTNLTRSCAWSIV